MKHPKLKILLTLLLTAVLIAGFIVTLVIQNALVLRLGSPKREALETEAIESAAEVLGSVWTETEERVQEQFLVSTELSAAALRSMTEQGEEPAVKEFAGGVVVKTENGVLKAPGNIARELGLEAALFTEERGLFAAPGAPSTLVVYSRIRDSSCYVEWHEDTVLPHIVEENVNFQEIMLRPEAACGGVAMLAVEDPSAESGLRIVYGNDLFSEFESLEEMGLTSDGIRKSVGQTDQTLTLRDTEYRYSVNSVPEIGGYLLMLIPKENPFVRSVSQSTYTIALIILFLAGTVVSLFSVSDYIQTAALSPVMQEKYRPSNIRRLAVLCGLIGIIMIAFCGWLDQSLNSLYDFAVRSGDMLAAAEKNIEMNAERDSRDAQVTEDIYLICGNKIAAILNDRHELRDSDTLRSFADSIHASSITLYDSRGRETACSGDLIDLELGSDPSSATFAFRQLLRGVPEVFRGAEIDEQTGLYEMKLGIRIDDAEEKGRYGAMIIALDPALLEHDTGEEINSILEDMTASGVRLWISDLETGVITASGDREMIGKSIYDLGMTEEDLKDALMRNLRTESGNYYVASFVPGGQTAGEAENRGGSIAFYAEKLDAPNYGISTIVTACIAFAVIYAILLKIALSGYTDEFFNEYRRGGIRTDLNTGRSGRQMTASGSATHREKVGNAWSTLPPGQRGLLIIEGISILFLLQQIPLTSVGKEYARDSVYYYIKTGNWIKGMNLFSLAAIANLAAEILLCVIVVHVILKGIAALAGTKGKTLCHLLISFVRYVALFTFLILAFTYLGVDRATIIASVGAFSLALSLGAQNLIDDVISGLAIVFEGTFQVGETVRISDCTGTVMDIGIRCTRILERDGDIVTISNRQIGQIVNMTQHTSLVRNEITVSASLEIEELEKMFAEELPKIGEGDMRFLNGPFYRGVIALGRDRMTLSIETECRGEDHDDVQQIVNRELQRLFRSQGIRI